MKLKNIMIAGFLLAAVGAFADTATQSNSNSGGLFKRIWKNKTFSSEYPYKKNINSKYL